MTARFWSKVDRTGRCWEWQAAKNAKGYGRFGWNGGNRFAHRVSWEIAYGPPPEGLVVMHRCDNPGCVRPTHLRLGTVADNNADCAAKGRSRGAKGQTNGRAKITERAVEEIRQRRRRGETFASIGASFGITRRAASYAFHGDTWGHVR